jgi:lipopolysaccharide exporter
MTESSTEHRFLQSSLAGWLGQLVRLGVSFVGKLLLARLLLPGDHGVYEQALRLVTITAAVRDLGLPYHLIRDRLRPYGTVLAFVALSGALLTGGLILLAPLTSVLTPRLPEVMQVYAVWVLLDGLATVPKTFFERELRIGRLILPEIARGVLGTGMSVFLAWQGHGVWSLVFGDLTAAAVFAGLVWLRARGQVPLEVDWKLVPRLLRQSRSLFLIWILIQLVNYIDVYIIEWFGTETWVGFYAKAYALAFLVPQVLAPRAIPPALVAYRDDAGRFADTFRLGTVFLLTFQVTAGYFLFFNAEKAVLLLYGDQWGPSVPLLRVLCFVPFLQIFTDLGGEVLKVRHEDRLWLIIMALNLLSLVACGIWLTQNWGAWGMACANFALLGDLLMFRRMAQVFAGRFAALLRDLIFVYLTPLPLFAAAALLTPADTWLRLGVSILAAALAVGLLAKRFYGPYRSFFGPYSSAGPER